MAQVQNLKDTIMKLSGKIVVITGASKGLGKEIALRLGRKRARLVLVARTEGLLQQVQREIENKTGTVPLIITCDITKEEDVQYMAATIRENYDRVDVLINNAGIGLSKMFETMTSAEIRRQFEVNVFGTMYCIKALLPCVQLSDAGYILNIGSLLGETAFAATSVYSATKFALSGFSEGFRNEMKMKNIKVGLFLPGPMNTSFHDTTDKDARLKIPSFLMVRLDKAVDAVETMIAGRKNKVYLPRWVLALMKIRRFFE